MLKYIYVSSSGAVSVKSLCLPLIIIVLPLFDVEVDLPLHGIIICHFFANFGWRLTSHHAKLLWRGFRIRSFKRGLTCLRMHGGRQSFHAIDKAAQTKTKLRNRLRKQLWNRQKLTSACGFLIRPADRWLTFVHFKTRLRLPPWRHGCRGSGVRLAGKFHLFIISVCCLRQHD